MYLRRVAGLWSERVLALSTFVAATCLVGMVLLVGAELFCRNLLGFSLLITDEFTGYLLVAFIFFGMPSSFRSGAFLRVDFLYNRLSGAVRKYADLLFDAAGSIFVSLLLQQAARLTATSYARGEQAMSLVNTPLWIPQLAMSVGLAILLCAVLLHLIGVARR